MAVRKGLEENLTWLGRKKSVHPRDKGWEEGRLRDIPRSATKPSAVSQRGTGKECSCVRTLNSKLVLFLGLFPLQ